MPVRTFLRLLIICSVGVSIVRSDQARVAVASNFLLALQRLTQSFEQSSHHQFTLVTGSTGKLYAQIRAGAPYDLFFSADEKTPRKLLVDLSLPEENFATYAHGRLAFWVPGWLIPGNFDLSAFIQSPDTKRIAIANPKLAPYGQATLVFLEKAGLSAGIKEKLSYGENISQAFHFVSSGAADAGFVALSLFATQAKDHADEIWLPESQDYPTIKQSVLLLTENEAARELYDFLKTDTARNIIQQYGYELPND